MIAIWSAVVPSLTIEQKKNSDSAVAQTWRDWFSHSHILFVTLIVTPFPGNAILTVLNDDDRLQRQTYKQIMATTTTGNPTVCKL